MLINSPLFVFKNLFFFAHSTIYQLFYSSSVALFLLLGLPTLVFTCLLDLMGPTCKQDICSSQHSLRKLHSNTSPHVTALDLEYSFKSVLYLNTQCKYIIVKLIVNTSVLFTQPLRDSFCQHISLFRPPRCL